MSPASIQAPPDDSGAVPCWPAGDTVTPANRCHDAAWRRAWRRQRRALERFPHHVQPIVMLGDSTVSCWAHASRGRVPWARHFADIALNCGVKGDETQHLRWRLRESEWNDIEPRAVVVSCGANHRYRDSAAAGYAAGLRALVHDLSKRWPATPRILLSMPWAELPDRIVSPLFEQFADATRRIASERVNGHASAALVLRDWCLPDGRLDENMVNDDVHPTRSGYSHLVGALRAAFAEVDVRLAPPRSGWGARLTEPLARVRDRLMR
ncbi:MAG TPA: GDSL-type esterase/lipase family protein [Gemmatimonadaceae bacterium]|nr:GDSL-type esterase/lipase family protein [Gemmatimonadaceae bacterium]